MKERIRAIVHCSIRVGWIVSAVFVSVVAANRQWHLFGQQETGLIQSFEAAVYNKANEERVKHGLPELAWASDIAEVARRHSEDMAVKGYFAHVNQEEETVSARLEKAGVVFVVSAENLFMSNAFTEIADKSVRGWMNSPSHRDNLLNADVTDTGVGIHKAPKGRDYYITQIFIQRALKIVPSPSRLSRQEVDAVFDIIKTSIKKSRYEFHYSAVKKTILKELADIGMPVKEDVYIEGLLKDIPVLGMTIDIIAGNGFLIRFTDEDPDKDLETYSKLVHPQGYSAAVLIHEADGEIRFPLIEMKQSEQ